MNCWVFCDTAWELFEGRPLFFDEVGYEQWRPKRSALSALVRQDPRHVRHRTQESCRVRSWIQRVCGVSDMPSGPRNAYSLCSLYTERTWVVSDLRFDRTYAAWVRLK
jgi:hypothetical protein